ncbi:YbfB/YjiJ family MFS transporter, partial [Spongiibacter marinus]|uniref:YbfB/YjiJ family MFS transporter n=1 Tax=Spongiibacter marinus TaxID=354246 RepID=UPI0035BE497C
MVLVLPALFIAASNNVELQRFNGDFGSFAERSFHLSVVHHALMDHPLSGALGYGLRQYGAHLRTQSADFNEDTVPLSVAQWAFEAGLPIALAGMAALGAAMGIGRFAFTPLLPMMLRDGVLTLAGGSWLATVNYVGYLAGALACMALPWLAPRTARAWQGAPLTRWGLAATVLLTCGMALPV